MLAGLAFFEMLSQYARSAFQGSAAVRGPNPPRPFARCRDNQEALEGAILKGDI